MKPLVPYTYRVQRRLRAGRPGWLVAVVPPRGKPDVLACYRTLRQALETARTLALGGGMVEVRS